MTDDDWRELGLPTDEEIEENHNFFKRMEESGIVDTQKYFDRIHDKVFSLNNILIAAYFALIAFRKDIPDWIFVIPIANSLMLLNIDYRMLARARTQSKITEIPGTDVEKFNRLLYKTNLYSLLSIWSTIMVTLLFAYFLLF
ncbi:hypothetical protein [Sphingobacterium corticibacter]|uniref:Uncharacterized protein n=1 Tax=Sphingobacterium corticibacter TaxID=2171749 RepID=A0A2T8HLI3_9SPHI|nr:hypothetical protein [Sphingobacterium corticibacter]PVH26309.1 hypothetical protein DC487_01390 [Sphingobacterium corticibacter]